MVIVSINKKIKHFCYYTCLAVKAMMYQELNIKEVGVGLEINW